jgi:hypothetical protein
MDTEFDTVCVFPAQVFQILLTMQILCLFVSLFQDLVERVERVETVEVTESSTQTLPMSGKVHFTVEPMTEDSGLIIRVSNLEKFQEEIFEEKTEEQLEEERDPTYLYESEEDSDYSYESDESEV